VVVVVSGTVVVVLTGLVVVVVSGTVVVVVSGTVVVVLTGLVVVVVSGTVVVVLTGLVVVVVSGTVVVVLTGLVVVVVSGTVVVVVSGTVVVVVSIVPHGGWLITNLLNDVMRVPLGKVMAAAVSVYGPSWLLVSLRKCATPTLEASVNTAWAVLESLNNRFTGPKSLAVGGSPSEVVIPFMMMCQPSRSSSHSPLTDEYGVLSTSTVTPGPATVAPALDGTSTATAIRATPPSMSASDANGRR